MVDACGNGPAGFGTDGGIVTNGSGGAVAIVGNVIRRIGAEDAGGGNIPGILINQTREPVVCDNIVEQCKSGGVWFVRCQRVTMRGCTLRANGDEKWHVFVTGDSFASPESIVLSNNRIIGDGADAIGIYMTDWNSGVPRVTISDNELVGVGSSGADGFLSDKELSGIITNNRTEAHGIGWNFGTALSDALSGQVYFAQNSITSCGTGVSVGFSSSPDKYGFSFQNRYAGNTTDIGGATAARLKLAMSVFPKRVFFDTAAPASGAWIVGDTVMNSTPVTSSPMGWMCTSAGSPGTWAAMPNL